MTMHCERYQTPSSKRLASEAYQLTLIVRLGVLGDLRNDHISTMVPNTCVRLEEDERVRWWCTSGLPDCVIRKLAVIQNLEFVGKTHCEWRN